MSLAHSQQQQQQQQHHHHHQHKHKTRSLVCRYTLLQKIGQGAFGSVHRAWDKMEGCDVAVKIVKTSIVGDSSSFSIGGGGGGGIGGGNATTATDADGIEYTTEVNPNYHRKKSATGALLL
jgi:serine/threonine protein kinase